MKIEIPKECPCCDYPLEQVNDQLFCRNTSCSAKTDKQIEHFFKALDIKGFGPKTVEKLNLQDITEIYTLTLEELAEAVGSKTAEKLLSQIEKSKEIDLETLLPGFSIPLIGNSASKKLCQNISSIDDINKEVCKLSGLGDKATQNLLNWLETDFQELRAFLPFSFKTTRFSTQVVQHTESKGSVCITGKLKSFKTKAEAKTALELLGFQVTDSITKATTILVDEDNRGSSKRKKAEDLGLLIISNLESFLKENYYDSNKQKVD